LKQVRWQNRAHFFGIAAELIRRILVDFARKRHQAERGGFAQQVSLEESAVVSKRRTEDFAQEPDG
jgi:ECF sigma factor